MFHKRQVAWLVVAFAFFSLLILSAMQVGFAVTPLNDNYVFGRVSYGFVVFIIFLVAFTMMLKSLSLGFRPYFKMILRHHFHPKSDYARQISVN